jgi:hypothetical protein
MVRDAQKCSPHHEETEPLHRHCERSEAIQSIDKKLWIASSLLLLAMTSPVIQGRASLARARNPWRHHSAGRNGFRVRIFDAPRNDVPPKNPISQTRSTLSRLSSRRPKNISLNPPGKSHLRLRASRLDKRGVGHRHERWAGCGGRFGGAKKLTVKSCGPDAPILALTRR